MSRRNILRGLHKAINESKATDSGAEQMKINSASQIPIHVLFLNALEATIVKENTKPNLTSQTYKPSSLNCIRNMYYQVVGMALGENLEEADSNLVGMGESGTHRHNDIQGYIEKMKDYGYPFEYIDVEQFIKENNLTYLDVTEKKGHEYKIHDNLYNITFLTDGLIRCSLDNKVYVFEFKTETSKKWYERTEVDEKHHNQAILYASRFGLDGVIFVYENRDTCNKKTYYFHVSDRMKEQVLGKIETCQDYVNKRELPPMTDNKRDCYYCKYKEYCKVDANITEVKVAV